MTIDTKKEQERDELHRAIWSIAGRQKQYEYYRDKLLSFKEVGA